MRAYIVCLICIAILSSCSSRRETPRTDERIKRIEQDLVQFSVPLAVFMQDTSNTEERHTLAERMAYYKVPGVSIAVIDGDTLAWAKGYGTLEAGSGAPVTTESIFQAAAASKLVTAVMALHFVENGTIDLDCNVNDYLTSWKVPDNEFSSRHPVTLRLLMSNRAGMPATGFRVEPGGPYPTLIQVLDGEPPALNKPAAPEYTPGTKWAYSDLGWLVIQKLLEDVGGKPFVLIADELVFTPLGMSGSTFSYPLMPDDQPREAKPHDDRGIAREPSVHMTALAHASLMTTPGDLARFAIELMRAWRGEPSLLLSHDTARMLFHREIDIDPRLFKLPLAEGLGVLLYGENPHFLFLAPGSARPGTNCWLIGAPASGDGAVIMTNGLMGEVLGLEIAAAIMREYRWPIDQPPTL